MSQCWLRSHSLAPKHAQISSDTCKRGLTHVQTQIDSSPRGKPALGNAGPCRGAGSLPPCGPSAAPWCPGHPKASSRSGAAVAAAAWGRPACRVVGQDTHFAGGRGVSSASGPGPGALRSPPLRLPSCGRGGRGPRSPVLVAEVTCKPRQAGGPPACPRRKRV